MLIMVDYRCDACGVVTESLERRPAPASRACACGAEAQRALAAPKIRTAYGWVTPGKSDERPPWAMDTRALAEGQPYHEWREERRKGRADQLRAGIVDPQVYV